MLNKVILIAFGFSGAAALIYEVVWIRSLSTVMGSSVYASSTMLGAFMAGLSLGGWIGSRLCKKYKNPAIAFGWTEAGIGIAGLLTVPFIEQLNPLYIKIFYAFHLSFSKFSLVQFFLCFIILGIPTTLMGITFPLVVKHFTANGEDAGVASGRLYSINTLGAILGSLSAGFLLIPAIGLKAATMVAAGLNGITAIAILVLAGRLKNAAVLVPIFLFSIAGFKVIDEIYVPFFTYYSANRFGSQAMAKSVDGMLRNKIGRRAAEDFILFHESDPEGEVYVLKNCFPSISDPFILINGGKLEAGDDKGFRLLGMLPYFSHRAENKRPARALGIGLGSGHTLVELAKRPLMAIDSIEINAKVIEANRKILSPGLFKDGRIRHIRADGRNFLRLERGFYDLIVVTPSWAVDRGSAGFLTREFFETARSKLGDEGVLAFWTDSFLASNEDIEVILRTASKSFPAVNAWKTEEGIIIVASLAPMRSPSAISSIITQAAPELEGVFSLAFDADAVAGLPPGEINTDDHPIIELRNARNIIRNSQEYESLGHS